MNDSEVRYVRINPLSVAMTEMFFIGVKSYRKFRTWKGDSPASYQNAEILVCH